MFVPRLYLSLVLGNVNVTLLSNQAKYVNHLVTKQFMHKGSDCLHACQSHHPALHLFLCVDLPTKMSMRSSNFI